MARARRQRFVRPAPKTKVWIGAGVGSTTVVANSLQVVGSLNASALAFRPFTILRTRLTVMWESDQIAAPERPQGDLGFIVASEQAVAIGSTAIPDPSSTSGDPDADWFIHQPLMTSVQESSQVGFQARVGEIFVVDSKAMRKVLNNQDIITMVRETGNVGAILVTRGRMLIQLH